MAKKIDDLDEKIKEAAREKVLAFRSAYTSAGYIHALEQFCIMLYNSFIGGANFMRELMQGEVDRLTFDRDNLSQSFFKLQQSASDGIILLENENQNLREQLAVAIGFLEELYFYDTCTACDNNFDMRDKALSKIKGGAE